MMRKILRNFYRHLLPGCVRSSIDIFKNLRMEETNNFQEKRVVVLAPHPDDDILGSGGTLRIYHQKGAEITAVYMTDGRKGGIGEYDEDKLVLLRKDEARKAAEVLGIDRLIFLDNRDSELSLNPKTVKGFLEILMDLDPDSVFLPFPLDNHRDHIATNDIFVEATRKYKKEILCYGYEVWTPLNKPNCIVDITEVVSIKITALQEHKSQMREFNLIDATVGLSQYRGVMHLKRDRNAEAFIKCTVAEYRRLWEIIQQ